MPCVNYRLPEIGLVLISLFNGISTFVGYLMTKLFLWKKRSGAIYPIGEGISGFIPSSKIIVRK